MCGLRVLDEQQRRANDHSLKLPDDLTDDQCEQWLQPANAAWLGADCRLQYDHLVRHATAALMNVVSGCLDGTGAQAMRTAVPLHQWPATRRSLRNSIAHRLSFAKSPVVATVHDDLVPLAYQALGTTGSPMYATDTAEPAVLFDIYAYAVRRYTIDYTDVDLQLLDQWLDALDSATNLDAERFAALRKQLADKAMCQYSLVDEIDSRNAFQRQFEPPAPPVSSTDTTVCR
jgi:hypothetical protein